MDFAAIYEAYFRDVYHFLLSLSEDPPLAEELCQETFFKAMRAIHRFDGSQDIRAWLFTIARNCYYSHCRKRKKTVSQEELPRDISQDVRVEDHLANQETAFEIHEFLHAMKEPYKEVFTLRVFGELSFEKIGRLFGKSPGWARVTFYRAKLQIVTYMEARRDEKHQL